ncbi:unnamed protein product, partial [Ixodes hexagonus]
GVDASASRVSVNAGAASNAAAAFPCAVAHEWTGPNPFPGAHQRRRPPAPQITQSVCRPRRGQPSPARVVAAAARFHPAPRSARLQLRCGRHAISRDVPRSEAPPAP